MNSKKIDVVIIGGGLTGLTIAHHLRKAGKTFVLLEKADRVGGVIGTVSENGFLYETGPNTGVIGSHEAAELFEDLQALCKIETPSDNVKKRFILKNATWQPLPGGLWQGITTPLFTWGDKFRILGEPFRAKGKNPHETLAELVLRRMGRSFLDYAIDPFILGVYSGDPAYLVPKYAFPKLYNLEQNYGSFIGGAIKKQFEKPDERSKKATRKVFSANGGLQSLVNALVQSSGSQNIVTGAADIQAQPQNQGWTITYSKNGENITLQSDKVVTTVGAYTLPSVLPFVMPATMQKITNLRYARVLQVAVGFNQWEGIPLDGFGGLIPFKENRKILGVLYMSSLFEGRAPKGGALLSVFVGGIRRDELTQLNDEQIRDMVGKELVELMKLPSFKPDLLKIMRYSAAIPQYGADSGDRFAVIETLEGQYQGLTIGGNLRDGIGMSDRIKQATILAQQLCK